MRNVATSCIDRGGDGTLHLVIYALEKKDMGVGRCLVHPPSDELERKASFPREGILLNSVVV